MAMIIMLHAVVMLFGCPLCSSGKALEGAIRWSTGEPVSSPRLEILPSCEGVRMYCFGGQVHIDIDDETLSIGELELVAWKDGVSGSSPLSQGFSIVLDGPPARRVDGALSFEFTEKDLALSARSDVVLDKRAGRGISLKQVASDRQTYEAEALDPRLEYYLRTIRIDGFVVYNGPWKARSDGKADAISVHFGELAVLEIEQSQNPARPLAVWSDTVRKAATIGVHPLAVVDPVVGASIDLPPGEYYLQEEESGKVLSVQLVAGQKTILLESALARGMGVVTASISDLFGREFKGGASVCLAPVSLDDEWQMYEGSYTIDAGIPTECLTGVYLATARLCGSAGPPELIAIEAGKETTLTLSVDELLR